MKKKAKKNSAAAQLGRLGGIATAKVIRERMTPEERRDRAKKAATARWGKANKH